MKKETHAIEFKQSWHDEYLEWICGYANAYGGTLYIGRADDGTPVGVAKAKSFMESIPCKITDTMGIIADVNLLEENGKDVIEIKVEKYPSLISYHGKYFYRSGTTMRTISGKELDRLILKQQGMTWDAVPMHKLKVRDLDSGAIRFFKDEAVKDYSGGNPVQISVYPDRIYVWNDGRFPPELNTAAKLFGKHSSKPYNPGLAGVFFKCGLIEAWGRGFDKITAGCKEYGGPRPSYKIGESGVMVLCKACPAYLELQGEGGESQTNTTQRTTQTATQRTTQTTTQKILAIIRKNPNVSRTALSKEIGISSDGIKWHLQKLKEGNAIRHVGPKYGGHWEVVDEV